ncbi:unnamed protein product [Angiostrongylus costaricensis]|uniref:Oxidoreductase n=1 Tax=Angiostrongylus costaricensis TaxID=334426 RepID=A0A0R3PHD6_ANGCS|nr:unnamed protein product [Angiostrongylus costaricensis]
MSLRDWAVRAVANSVEITPCALFNLPIPANQIKTVQNLLVHRLQYVSIYEPNPLVGKLLRATVRSYMSFYTYAFCQQPAVMNGTQPQLVDATSGRLAGDQEQFEE